MATWQVLCMQAWCQHFVISSVATAGKCQKTSEKKWCDCLPQNCISRHPECNLPITNRMALTLSTIHAADAWAYWFQNGNSTLRHGAYRQYIYWQYGTLGTGNLKVIPSWCLEKQEKLKTIILQRYANIAVHNSFITITRYVCMCVWPLLASLGCPPPPPPPPPGGGLLPMWWVIHMCRGFDPLFSLWQDRARSFWVIFFFSLTSHLTVTSIFLMSISTLRTIRLVDHFGSCTIGVLIKPLGPLGVSSNVVPH